MTGIFLSSRGLKTLSCSHLVIFDCSAMTQYDSSRFPGDPVNNDRNPCHNQACSATYSGLTATKRLFPLRLKKSTTNSSFLIIGATR